jgi:hypothetical protein
MTTVAEIDRLVFILLLRLVVARLRARGQAWGWAAVVGARAASG